ncbi:MAG: hypothetical protein QOF57_692 [Frankiaceae bacterium]|nr:hypothetical protein [Frankiaceae bacterium]
MVNAGRSAISADPALDSVPGRLAARPGGGLLARHWHHLALAVWAAICALLFVSGHGQSWHFFATGAHSLLCTSGTPPSACGIHLYAAHPELQIGPVSFLVAAAAAWWPGDDGVAVAAAAMMLAGLLALGIVEYNAYRSSPVSARPRLQARVFLAGVVFMPAWADLAVHFGHLDDVLALVFTALAVRCVDRRAPAQLGACLALATLSKPWAVAFLPLVFAIPHGRLRAVLWATVPVALIGAVFVIGDPATLHAAGFGIPNAPSSPLRILGIADPTTPSWDRPAQFTLGIVLGLVAVRRGRWPAVVMVAAAARIALDPGVYSYYTAAILLGAIVWDLHARRGRIFPAWSWLVFGALFACRYLPLTPTTLGSLRLAVCVVVTVCALSLNRPLGQLARRD